MTSHVDLIPTMLSLANIDASAVQKQLQKSHTEVHPFVGQDLSGILRGESSLEQEQTPIFFMTDDDPTKGLHQTNFLGESYPSVIQPTSHSSGHCRVFVSGRKGNLEIRSLS